MTVDTINFTPWLSLTGGLMIGLAALVLMMTTKSVMGVSGITRQTMMGPNRLWRLAYLVGTVAAAALYVTFVDVGFTPDINKDTGLLMSAGLIVGIGTAIGNGCTSGHGVCGLSRLSKRSLVSVVLFIGSAMVTVLIMK